VVAARAVGLALAFARAALVADEAAGAGALPLMLMLRVLGILKNVFSSLGRASSYQLTYQALPRAASSCRLSNDPPIKKTHDDPQVAKTIKIRTRISQLFCESS